MTKEERHALAAVGVATRLRELEAELGAWFKEYPEVFLGKTAPQLARPALRNGNGHNPLVGIVATKGGAYHGKLRHPGALDGKSKVAAQRARTAQLLELIAGGASKDELRAAGSLTGLGGLVRRGYIKRSKKGDYTRTAKPFIVNPAEAFKDV